ncbi:MAG: PIG-L family deacetylase [Lentisphaerae bacterium]|nr:PIG-L family deacetylase [Lentisphaerota bacterium]
MFRGAGPRSVRELPLPSTLRAMVLAPHPDDFDAIGVTLKFLSDNGNPILVRVVRTGSGIEDAYRPGLTLAEKADLREDEQRRSLQFFSLPEDCLAFLALSNDADDQPEDSPENRAAIASLVQKEAPDIVFLPHGNDTNSGHRVMYSLFARAARQVRRPLVAFLNRDPKTVEMRIDLYMPFGQEEADWKALLLRFHDSQHQRNLLSRGHGFDDRILGVNRAIAQDLSLRCEYAEAFEVEMFNMHEKRIPTTESNASSC